MMNIKRYITIMLIVLSVDVSAQVTATFDSQNFVQNALQFAKQWAEMIEQGADQAEQLQLELEAENRRIQAVKEEVKEIVDLTKKILILYREIDYCNTSLENLRKNLVRSNIMSLEEKYTIYSRAQNLCYDIFKRKNEIDDVVEDCKKYSDNKKAEKKKEKIEEITDVVRQVSKSLRELESMSVELIQYKTNAIKQDYMIRKCFSLKLY